ncbi:hypothetical protein [Leuconostoc citreum]
MEKLKQNKIWLTIIVIGVVIIGILLAMLHQQKQSSPEAQSSSYASSAKAASSSQRVEDQNNEKVYAKKASNMKGHVYSEYFTTWSENDFKAWANKYMNQPESERHKDGVSESFGTSTSWKNSRTNMVYPLDKIAKQIQSDGYVFNYYKTVKDFNKDYPGVNPDDIKK